MMASRLLTTLLAFSLSKASSALPTAVEDGQTDVYVPLGPGTVRGGAARLGNAIIPEFVALDPEILRRVVESNVTETAQFMPPGAAQAEKRGIIGPTDDRVLWTDRNFPYSPIGRLLTGGSLCSATLVGPRHVATAAHCIAKQGESMRFYPAYAGTDTYPSSAVQYVLQPGVPIGAPCWEMSDWAILILEDRLGDQRGFFGARVIEPQHLNRNVWYHMGYPGDKAGGTQPYRQGGITVSRMGGFSDCPDTKAMLVTDADAIPGTSGGPLWLGPEWDANGNRFVYGVASATSNIDTAFSGGSVFTQWVAASRINYP